MTTTDEVAQTLMGAAQILTETGWTQGAMLDPETGRRDAAGAIEVAARRIAGWPEEARAVNHAARLYREAIDRLRDQLDRGVIVWNDEPQRTADEVVRELRAAAERRAL